MKLDKLDNLRQMELEKLKYRAIVEFFDYHVLGCSATMDVSLSNYRHVNVVIEGWL